MDVSSQMIWASSLLVGIFTFIVGLQIGRRRGLKNIKSLAEAKDRTGSRLSEESSFRRSLQIQIDQLKEQNHRYLQLFVTLPEAVKRLSSNLTVDEVTSSIVRLTYDLISAGKICLFLYRPDEKRLHLALAYGLDKNKFAGLSYALGEGKIGITGEARIVLTAADFRDNPEFKGGITDGMDPLEIDLCAPIRFKEKLHGVLSVGQIKQHDQNNRTFLAMVADLAAISLDNAQLLDDAHLSARIDPLTKLYNRRYFQERLLEEAWKCINYNFECSIFIFDLDNFKIYNDQNGHPAGDQLLKQVATIVKFNSRGTNITARYGGEEFIVLLSNTGKDQAFTYAENICKLIASIDFPHKEKQPMGIISISGGVASFPKDARSLEEAIQKADEALYEAKRSGRNRIHRFPDRS
jgi:diguanylate cyclase (GGDEF)-like protein